MKLGPRLTESEILEDDALLLEAYERRVNAAEDQYRRFWHQFGPCIRRDQRRGASPWGREMNSKAKCMRRAVSETRQAARRLLEGIDDE